MLSFQKALRNIVTTIVLLHFILYGAGGVPDLGRLGCCKVDPIVSESLP